MNRTESTFETVQGLLSAPHDPVDLLRIVAKDAEGLKADEREIIRSGADDLETAYRYMTRIYGDLLEAKQHLVALSEQAVEARAKQLKPTFWSASVQYSAPMRLQTGLK